MQDDEADGAPRKLLIGGFHQASSNTFAAVPAFNKQVKDVATASVHWMRRMRGPVDFHQPDCSDRILVVLRNEAKVTSVGELGFKPSTEWNSHCRKNTVVSSRLSEHLRAVAAHQVKIRRSDQTYGLHEKMIRSRGRHVHHATAAQMSSGGLSEAGCGRLRVRRLGGVRGR